MSRQIIQMKGPSEGEMRRRAFDEAMSNIQQGMAGLGQAIESGRSRQASRRQQAFEMLQKQAAGGQQITPEMEQQAYEAAGYDPEKKYGMAGIMQPFQDAQEPTGKVSPLVAMMNEQATQAQEKRESDAAQAQANLDLTKARTQALETKAEKAKQAKEQAATPQARLQKLGAEAKNKIGSMAEGVRALNQMEAAMKAGYKPEYVDANTPLIGKLISDNPFTSNRQVLNEVVSRLQTGAAITKSEEERFYEMGPRPGDSPDMQARKLAQQRAFLANKLAAFGFKEEELPGMGFQTTAGEMKPAGAQGATSLALNLIKAVTPEGFSPLAPGVAPERGPNLSPMADAVASPEQMQFITSPQRTQERQSRIQQLRAKAAQGGM